MKVDLKDKFITLCARRGSGKSEMMKWLINKQRSAFKEIFVISPSSFNDYWKGIVPDENIMDTFKEEWVEALVSKMADANKGKTKATKGFKRVLLILDDVVSSEISTQNSRTMKILAARGRHLGVCCMISSQNVKSGVSPLLRNNTDYLLLGKINPASIDIIYEEFNLTEMNENAFREFVRKNTDDYNFLVINNCASNTSDLKQVYGRLKVPENEL